MSKDNGTTRILRVIEGGNAPDKHRRPRVLVNKRTGKKHRIYKWECARCEDEGGRCSQLKQVRVGAMVQNDKLYSGELWWACERCGDLVSLIRRYKLVLDED